MEKKNLYADTREEKEAGEQANVFFHISVLIVVANQDTMDTWDEEKLRNVVLSKHGNPRTTTDVCLVPRLSKS